jgi:hypothetical protein
MNEEQFVNKFNQWMPDFIKNEIPNEIKKVQEEILTTLENGFKNLDYKEIYRANGLLST